MQQLPNIPTYQIGPENIVYVVQVDKLIHDVGTPFCDDPECPCHEDRSLVSEYVTCPLDLELLSNAEAIRLYFGRTI